MRAIGDFAPLWENSDSTSRSGGGDGGAHRGTKRLRRDSYDENAQVTSSQASSYLPREFVTGARRTDPHYVSGHEPGASLPSASFPHSAADKQRTSTSKRAIEDELASLNPPLYSHPRISSRDNSHNSLQRQHAAVMSTILHVSLQRGDFVRASQAFSTLLRVGSGVNALSIRSGGNWGIGAEILLRRRPQQKPPPRRRHRQDSTSSVDTNADDNDTSLSEPPSEANSILLSNLSAAKEYYESLILQYPFRKTAPHATDARTFYPPLFGLMIYEATLLAQQETPSSSLSTNDDDSSGRAVELRAARAIATRMDDLLASPPYDRFVPLLRLRGMVGLWIADLIEGDADEHDDDDDRPRSGAAERDRARVWFERCRKAGGDVPDDI
ncbi:hypothetical protein K461DRAFT_158409 [Myriangium duriaei CBS 260.36]|uniref:Uncharacterized protein n=1 Tax=Myriangium duriaei CBS 260.36 TaxID=1168546 RepID=A0A9P4J244_9PEZI|nr:hypothetical protein K461DRAFT_158409 [Myriangium duriaei CBS 260.36]